MYIPGKCRLYGLFLRYFYNFEYIGRDVTIDPSCDIRRKASPYIFIGNHVTIAQDVWLNIPYEAPPPVKGNPIIRIEEGVTIGRRCFISGVNSITIGRKVLFGPGVFITDHNHNSDNPMMPIMDQGITEPGSLIIEEGCWFGYNSVVVAQKSKTITIGRNSVIGANSVVTQSCPPHSILVGCPARNIAQKNK